MSSLTPSARSTNRKSTSKIVNVDRNRTTEEDLLARNNLYQGISIDNNTDVITDAGEALRTEHWLHHQTVENVESIQPQATAVTARADVGKVGNDDRGIASSDISDINSSLSQTAAQPKNTDYQPDLRQRLEAACIRNLGGKSFIPVDRIYNLITRESVTEELQRVALRAGHPVPFIRSIHQIANVVCPGHVERTVHTRGKGNALEAPSRRKIFGILVSMDMSASIEVFLDADVSDMDLPIRIARHEGTTQVTSSAGLKVKALNDLLAEYNDSNSKLVEEFIDRQWEFIAPYFAPRSIGVRGDIPHYKLSRESVLPWMLEEQPGTTLSHEGGFGKVSRIRIHPSHHNFKDDAQVRPCCTLSPPFCLN